MLKAELPARSDTAGGVVVPYPRTARAALPAPAKRVVGRPAASARASIAAAAR
jgi:hypothetical protein